MAPWNFGLGDFVDESFQGLWQGSLSFGDLGGLLDGDFLLLLCLSFFCRTRFATVFAWIVPYFSKTAFGLFVCLCVVIFVVLSRAFLPGAIVSVFTVVILAALKQVLKYLLCFPIVIGWINTFPGLDKAGVFDDGVYGIITSDVPIFKIPLAPISDRAPPRFIVRVDFPTPPLLLAKQIIVDIFISLLLSLF